MPVVVGIPVRSRAAAARRTINALAGADAGDLRVVLLLDRPDPATATELGAEPVLAAVPRWTVDVGRGDPACFNRLAAGAAGAPIVFLESGAVPARDAIARLVRSLDTPGVGLAGPSTNRAWNLQRVIAPPTVEAAAATLRRRYGDTVHDVGALHALSDVCMAVHPAVLEAIGGADDGFGFGPCWEMEYVARAARAGFAAVWTCAAYVDRAPPDRARAANEVALFEASRRRYQDRLCGLRLDGTRPGWAPHCDGDVCAHFAPADRITIRLPLPERVPERAGGCLPTVAPVVASTPRCSTSASVPRGDPLVSCVMPTADRPEWVAQSIAYFRRQDHPARELIVVDDGDTDVRVALGSLLDDPAITHVRLPGRCSIGAKRNLGCERARGELIAQWDDDDWYAPGRLRAQVAPLAAGEADVTGLRDALWFDVARWRFRLPSASLHKRLFVEDVHGGTLVFTRSLWERGARYADVSLAEDAWFLREALRRRARLQTISAVGLYLYVRHDANSWVLPGHLDEVGDWYDAPEPGELAADRAFYAGREYGRPAAPSSATVSCIMPTADRRAFVPLALRAFNRQTVMAELVVVDDGDDPIQDLVEAADPSGARIQYIRLDRKEPIGTKRNVAVEAAACDVIAHWDDDDWSLPSRLTRQLETLASGADACGLDRMLWWRPAACAAWRYSAPALRRPWVAGNTLAYLRDAWARSPFPPQSLGEDTAFLWRSPKLRLRAVDDEDLVVGTIHGGNTSPKGVEGPAWSRVPIERIRRLLGTESRAFEAACSGEAR